MSGPLSTLDYGPGDTVFGRFSCTERKVEEYAVVTARVQPMLGTRSGFIGRNPAPPDGMGVGVWGYDDEIEEVVHGE